MELVTCHKMRSMGHNERNVKVTTGVDWTLLDLSAIAAPHDQCRKN